MHRVSTALALCGCLGIVGLACSSAPGESPGNGGSSGRGAGGSAGNAGSSGAGGSAGSGGAAGHSGGSGSGGSSGTGGKTGSGGSGSGGAGSGGVGSGGAGSGGSGSGGSSGTGGKTGSGGSGSGGVGSGGAGSGGSSGAGGSAGRGGAGSGGRGGATGGAGAAGNGGNSGAGGTTFGSGTGTGTSCTFTQQPTISTKIGTVVTVTWSTTLSNPTEAHIDFGLTTSYGYTAPVDLKAQNYSTLLLGMKPSKQYNYRIVAANGSGECTSPNYTITTGTLPNGMAKITFTTKSTASPLYGGFLIMGQYAQGGGSSGSPAYILDADGDYVWAYTPKKDATGVRMDYSGTHMWINSANVPDMGVSVQRVTLDGLTAEDLSSKFTGLSHQLTILPDETVAFYATGSNGCDDIKEYTPSTGNVKTIANSGTAEGGASACHCNNIQYSKDDDTLVFSDLDNQVIVKVKRSDGSTVWVMNGSKSTFSGDSWKGGNHGLQVLGLDDILLFNNNSRVSAGGVGASGGDGSGSIAIEMKLDLGAKKMTQTWSYKANPGIQNDIMGDVQRLPNGNTIVAYSTKGDLQEVSSSGTPLQEMTWPAGGQFGYIEKRATLYGPPPK